MASKVCQSSPSSPAQSRLIICEVLRSVAGKDATRAFKKYHHDRILSYRSTRDLVVGRVDHSLKTAMEQRGSMFGKLFDWAWRRGDTGLGAEVKNTETVAPATIEPQAEATKSKVEDV